MACKVKVNQHGFLALRLFWDGIESWEGTGLEDSPENRQLLEAKALIISQEIKTGSFEYLKHFPNGNKAYLFRKEPLKAITTHTVKSYFNNWIKKQTGSVQFHRIEEYESHFSKHILPAKIENTTFGKLHLASVTVDHLKSLQDRLREKGLKASSVNAVVHSSLRAMLRDARGEGVMIANLYDRAIFKPLPLTDKADSIDPYTSEEREAILDGFKQKRPFYFAFVHHQFWTGARPSETTALRWGDIDLIYNREKIQRSRVQGHEAGTKTVRSNREIHLHANLAEVLKAHMPLHVGPENYVFTTPEGTPIDESNFYKREWLPMLRRLQIRPRPFYNARHSYASFLLSIGAKPAFISAQTGDSIRTLERYYAKYLPQADSGREMVEESILESETLVKPNELSGMRDRLHQAARIKKPLRIQGLKNGAGDGDRTHDLMLGKHTL